MTQAKASNTRRRAVRRTAALLLAVALTSAACDQQQLLNGAGGEFTSAPAAAAPAPAPAKAPAAAPLAAAAPAPAATTAPGLNEAEAASLALLNQLRASQSLGALRNAADISAFSESWSLEMSRTGFRHSTQANFGHLFVNGRTSFGENIVYTSDTSLTPAEVAQLFHKLWVESPGHYSNMVGTGWTEVGIGIELTSTGWYGTHNFMNG